MYQEHELLVLYIKSHTPKSHFIFCIKYSSSAEYIIYTALQRHATKWSYFTLVGIHAPAVCEAGPLSFLGIYTRHLYSVTEPNTTPAHVK